MLSRNWIALGILLLLLAYIALVDRHLPSTDDRQVMQSRVFPVEKDSLTRLVIRDLVLDRDPQQGFRIVQPFEHPADPELCAPLFRQAENLTALSVLVHWQQDGRTLADFGLDAPRLTVKLTGKETRVLHLGAPVAGVGAETECYARLEGRPEIFVLKESLVESFGREAEELALRKPFAFIGSATAEVRWLRKNSHFSWIQRQLGRFMTGDQAQSWPADFAKSEVFFNVLENLDLFRNGYHWITDTDAGIPDPEVQIEVTGENRRQAILIVGGPSDQEGLQWVKMERGGLGFRLPVEYLTLFDSRFETLAARQLFEGPVTQLGEVQFLFPADNRLIRLAGAGTDWNCPDHPHGALFASGKILNLILKFAVTAVEDPEPMELETPFLVVQCTYLREDMGSDFVVLYRDEQGVIRARVNGSRSVGRIGKAPFLEVLEDPYLLLAGNAVSLALDGSDTFYLKNTRENLDLRFDRDSLRRWKADPDFAPGPDVAAAWLARVQSIKGYNALAYQSGVDFGFGDPLYELLFYQKDAADPFLTLRLGSYSTLSSAFLLGNRDFIIFSRDCPLLEEEPQSPEEDAVDTDEEKARHANL